MNAQQERRVEDRRIGHSLSFLLGLADAAGEEAFADGAFMVLIATIVHEHRQFDGQKPN